MIVSEHILKSASDGLPLSFLTVRPESQPVAVLQISHGMCGFKERYLPMMENLASKGVMCVANDHRGHGCSIRSDEDLGYMYEDGYEALVSDMRMIYEFVSELCPTAPFYLLGHSMGSLAALLFYRRWGKDLSGLILCGIPYKPSLASVSRFVMKSVCTLGGDRLRLSAVQKLTSSIYNRRFSTEGPQAWTCSDPSNRLMMGGGARTGFYFTANGSYNLISMLVKAYAPSPHSRSADIPVMLLAGQDDPCSGYAVSLDRISGLLRSEGCTDIRIGKYPHMRHEILNEKGKEQVWEDIRIFMT